MISVEELHVARADATAPAAIVGEIFDVAPLDEDSENQLNYLDATIEPTAATMTGDMFDIVVDPAVYPVPVIEALKTRWELGGWLVGVFSRATNAIQVIFARPRAGLNPMRTTQLSVEKRAAALSGERGAVDASPSSAQRAPRLSTPLLIRMPTRGRPDQALSVLSAYRELATDHVRIEVVIDEDDAATNNTLVLQQLCDLDCTVSLARHRNKIEAVNGGRCEDWAILALVSDDMVPVVRGYDRRILAAMEQHYPLLDGAIYFDDGYNKTHAQVGRPVLCTLPIMGRHLYDQFGYVYYPKYGSLYSDNEQTDLLSAMRRITFVDEFIIEHRHHAASKAPMDALYEFNDKTYGSADHTLYEERVAKWQPHAQFAFDSPPLWLSILICSTPARAAELARLVDHLRAQMRAFPRQVEICVASDNGTLSIGEKRQQLLERAVGRYVAFVDDDDWVANDYVAHILGAVRESVPDCVSLHGIMTTNGAQPERFHHSIEHDGWFTRPDGLHCRTPNHLNPIRRELALQAGFPSKSFGEDHDFSTRVRPLLKTEATIDSVLYYYWFRSKAKPA